MRRLYVPLADIALIYDNSDEGRVLIAEHSPDSHFIAHARKRWNAIEEATT